ncbi:hypothetical protein [Dyella sp. 2HG41-7]|uniref:hypothetical protein n=1 Tax=Dyella sp. 2HG41-7 TaxID=2883239 RepID=UPI001F1935D7|nr:hypothetical protein [Dyella sp. 2HG41-7]
MSDAIGYLAIAFIVSTFLSGLCYYALLFAFAKKLKESNAEIWSLSRRAAKPFETDLMTAYRVLTSSDPGLGLTAGTSEAKLARATKRQLYISMAMFMVILAVGLYVSVDK